MKRKQFLSIFIALCALQFISCEKDEEIIQDRVPDIQQFMIESQIGTTVIDPTTRTISFEIGNLFDWRNLGLSYALSGEGMMYDGEIPLISNNSKLDLSQPKNITLASSDGKNRVSWELRPTSVLSKYGLGDWLKSGVSNEKAHRYYFDQGGTGAHQYINCGPAVSTMALKWADPTFAGTVEEARQAILPHGDWWYTGNIQKYLQDHGLVVQYYQLPQELSLGDYQEGIAAIIDAGKIGILCLDMFYVAREQNTDLHINKFYDTEAEDWGHFILVKGYKIVDGQYWIETMDPYSFGQTYADEGSLKGDHRYYAAAELKKATDIWWPYIMALSQNQPVAKAAVGRKELSKVQSTAVVHQHGGKR